MGYIELVVGRLDEDTEADVLDALDVLDAPGEPQAAWRRAPADVARLCVLNSASVSAFLEHAATLVEAPPGEHALDRAAERFPALPWGVPCVWLPIEVAPLTPASELSRVAAAGHLLRDLEVVRARSPLPLGHAPARYDTMRADFEAFVRSDDGIPAGDVVPWVWRALFDGARLALERDAPLRCW